VIGQSQNWANLRESWNSQEKLSADPPGLGLMPYGSSLVRHQSGSVHEWRLAQIEEIGRQATERAGVR
jgi:hypothetical protein